MLTPLLRFSRFSLSHRITIARRIPKTMRLNFPLLTGVSGGFSITAIRGETKGDKKHATFVAIAKNVAGVGRGKGGRVEGWKDGSCGYFSLVGLFNLSDELTGDLF
jgi:dihydropteroate synthase